MPPIWSRSHRGTRILLFIVLALSGLGGVAYLARFELMRIGEDLPRSTHSAGVERELRVAMEDGVELATTVYQPAGEGLWP